MKAKIKNTSRAPQGVHCVDGLKFIEPGATRTLVVADGYVERVKALPFLEAEWVDALDHDADGKKGGSVKQPADDDLKALRAEYAEKIGKKPFGGWDAETLRAKIAEAAKPE